MLYLILLTILKNIYLEKYAKIYSNRIKTPPKYNKYIQINISNPNQIFEEYFKYFNEFYNIYTSENVDFDLEPAELQEIINEITFWKNNIIDVRVRRIMDNAIKLLNKNYENVL